MIDTTIHSTQEININSELLIVKDLSVEIYTVDKRVEVLKGVSIKINKGEVVALVGESGSGKTTLAQAIIGIIDTPPVFITKGEVFFDGKKIIPNLENKFDFRGKGINMVLQEPLVSLNPVYTVKTQLEEAAEVAGIPETQRENVIKSTLDELALRDIDRLLNLYPHQISGGMRQRVAIALAVIERPRLIILDEPTTGLDLIVQRKIMSLLLNLRKDVNSSILIITHDLAVAANMADRIYVMYAGNAVESGRKKDIINNPLHPYSVMLRSSIPTGYKDSGPLKVTEGAVADITNLPPGCPFHPRCPHAMEICKKEFPPLITKEDNREVACWLYVQ
jgi:oligopeptide/dipeptide ABC transporter ATP-binding protein